MSNNGDTGYRNGSSKEFISNSTSQKYGDTNCDEYGYDKIVSDYEILKRTDTSNIKPENDGNMGACSMPNIRIFNKRKSKRQNRLECNDNAPGSLSKCNAKHQEKTSVESRMKNKVRVKSLDVRPEKARYHIHCFSRKSENDPCSSSSYQGCASSTDHRHKHHRLCKKFQSDFSVDEQENLGSPRSSNLSWNVVDEQDSVLRKSFVSRFRSSMSLPYTSIFLKSQIRIDSHSQHTLPEPKRALFDGDKNTTRHRDHSNKKSR